MNVCGLPGEMIGRLVLDCRSGVLGFAKGAHPNLRMKYIRLRIC